MQHLMSVYLQNLNSKRKHCQILILVAPTVLNVFQFVFLPLHFVCLNVCSLVRQLICGLLSDELHLFQVHIILLLLKHAKKCLQILLENKAVLQLFEGGRQQLTWIRIWENSNSDAVNKRSPRYHAYFR